MKKATTLLAAFLAAAALVTGCSSNENNGSAEVKRVDTVSVIDLEKLNDGNSFQISYYYDTDRVREISGKLSRNLVKNKEDAFILVRELADIIGCTDPLNELEFSAMEIRDGGWIYVFDQYYNAVPVRKGSVSILTDADGNTTHLYNNFIENVNIATEPKISAEEAAKLAMEKYGCDTKDEPKLVIIETGRESIYLTWDVKLKRSNYPDEAYIDALNGTVQAEDGPIID